MQWLRVGYGGQANAEPAAGLSFPPTHGVRRNYERTSHATVPCEDCDLGSRRASSGSAQNGGTLALCPLR